MTLKRQRIDWQRLRALLKPALALHPKIFDEVFVNLVQAGETTGQLAEILENLPPFLGGGEMIETVKMTGSTFAWCMT